METQINWTILIPVAIFAIALVLYLIFRNKKDQIDYEQSENRIIEKEDEETY